MNRRERKLIAKKSGVGTHNIGVMFPPMHKPLVKQYNIGRNDLCPCGSEKKYKNCCLETYKYENYE